MEELYLMLKQLEPAYTNNDANAVFKVTVLL